MYRTKHGVHRSEYYSNLSFHWSLDIFLMDKAGLLYIANHLKTINTSNEGKSMPIEQ